MKKRTLIIASSIVTFALVLALTVKPLFWIILPLIPAGILCYVAVLFSKSKWVSVIISLACLPAFYSAAEAYLYIIRPPQATIRSDSNESKYIHAGATTHVSGYNHIRDPLLGHAVKPMKVQTANKNMYGDIEIFDVLYSWDEKGRRLTPDNTATAKNLVILLGCSFTFGTALEDRETFAWQLSELLGTDFQVLNYGFHGYGSHQMLALLESDRLDYLKTKYENIYAFYLTFPGIERRSAGMARWNQEGPKYVLNKDGTVSYAGQLNTSFYSSIFGESEFLKVLKKRYTKFVHTEPMLDLHAAIILKSATVFNKKFEGDFVTVVYPNYEPLKKRLAKSDMEIIDLELYFDDYEANKEKYIIKYDGHPNLKSTKIITKAFFEHFEKNEK